MYIIMSTFLRNRISKLLAIIIVIESLFILLMYYYVFCTLAWWCKSMFYFSGVLIWEYVKMIAMISSGKCCWRLVYTFVGYANRFGKYIITCCIWTMEIFIKMLPIVGRRERGRVKYNFSLYGICITSVKAFFPGNVSSSYIMCWTTKDLQPVLALDCAIKGSAPLTIKVLSKK